MTQAHELLGGLFERKPQLVEAAREYQRALALRPDVARLHLRLGNVLALQGNGADAAQHLREAAGGSDPAIAQQAARALERLGVR
jgi:Tfp pilus assembly protein PilF